eukprot:CAMPEP_0194213304 /NCGR_PEP_ID=MMETSP0156-20130528/13757_1 /TAXON_ID=33649 /ORGANISM="Thalassionema nitzschioides, Strain L26-B" /LENGTH=542 /DNA_ID=CAMNT_0038941297 /DNA_START=82 /DNA_END=1706 /DNA_ORIENTATION=+
MKGAQKIVDDKEDVEVVEVQETGSSKALMRKLLIFCFALNLIIGIGFVVLPLLDREYQEEDSYLSTGVISEITKAEISQGVKKSTRRTIFKKVATSDPLRILYVITSLAEYNTGRRATDKGSDRLQDTLIPVMRESVLSMREMDYHVDVFIISHWSMKSERLQLVRQALPDEVGLDYWDDATPLGYRLEDEKHPEKSKVVSHITRALARQHRFVIKEKFLDYDFFVNFEDDMMVKGHHIQNHLSISNELFRLRDLAPEEPTEYSLNEKERTAIEKRFYGELTKNQLSRMMPGLVRVEVLLDEEKYPAQSSTGPIPVDLNFTDGVRQVNPEFCCFVKNETSSPALPVQPSADKLMIWETSIIALGIHLMPENSTLDWVFLQRGPSEGRQLDIEDVIGEYYSGQNKEFGVARPSSYKGKYINNQGGWMASRHEIWEWHDSICPGGFLPPFDVPHFNRDGLDLRNVEYWSGGLHLFTRQNACNLQRIVAIDPERFSKHLIYHSSNNKQRQRTAQREERFVKANTLLGQLNSVTKKALRVLPESEA